MRLVLFATFTVLSAVACGGMTDGKSADIGADSGASTTTNGNGAQSDGGQTSAIDGGASNAGRVPQNHRAVAAACPSARGSDEGLLPDSGITGACSSDADCTAGENGRCVERAFGALTFQCSYDECSTDTDCAGTVCICRADGSSVDPNFCGSTDSNCRVDADCGASGYCSPTESSDAYCYSADATYACHTPHDQCIDDSDCGTNGSCNYDPSVQYWKCGALCEPPPP